jgi:hypothetical protein
MKIIDTFLFSEPFEKEILFIKIFLGANIVNEWLIIENSFTFQGKYKGLFAQDIINSDSRFEPYRSRIKIISENYNPKNEASSDSEAFKVEYWQRNLATKFINNLTDEDYFFISDADECVDGTDEKRKEELLNALKKNPYNIYHVSCLRYWYDFDNQYEILYGIPLVSVRYFKASGKQISEHRKENIGPCKQKWNNIICFEYSHCLDMASIVQKYSSFSHIGATLSDIKEGLMNNCRILPQNKKQRLDYGPRNFFKIVQLNNYNSPSYVRENLNSLKTRTVDVNYSENRKKNFPEIFSTKNIIKYYITFYLNYVLLNIKKFIFK